MVRHLAESVAQHEAVLGGERSPVHTAPAVAEASALGSVREAAPAAGTAAPKPAQNPCFRWPRSGRHHCRSPWRHRRPEDRSLPAAHRDVATAQGALLRGGVAAQCRQRRCRRRRRFPALRRGRFAAAEARRPLGVAMRAGGAAVLLKNREIGLFCNLSAATLTDAGFPQLLEFIEANRAIAPSLVMEFTQSAVRNMGPMEHESLAALAERGFRFSMDNLSDLRIEPRELTARGFRFIKAPALLLLNRVGNATSNIHPADFSDLLGRFGIDLIAERIESELIVVDLLGLRCPFRTGLPVLAAAAGARRGAAGSRRRGRQRRHRSSIGRCRCRAAGWSAAAHPGGS